MTATEETTFPTQGLAPLVSQPAGEAAAEGVRIRAVLSGMHDRSLSSCELQKSIKDWASFYHLSPQRSAFLRSIRHLFKGRVLEISAECGAITRFLGETGCEVTAVESVPERAEAARLRCADLKNVEVLEASELASKTRDASHGPFDFAVIRLTPPTGPAIPIDWAELRTLLAPDGRLIVIAANRLWPAIAGAPGSQAESLSQGATGYRELQRRLEQAGFPHQEIGFLYPDFDAPPVVFSSEAFAAKQLDLLSFFDTRNSLYRRPGSPALNWEALRDANLLADFAGGFLIVAGQQKPVSKAFPQLVSLYSLNRRPEFAKESTIEIHNSKLRIRRKLLFPNSKPNHDPVCRGVLQDEPWLPGEPYSGRLSPIMKADGWSIAPIAIWARPWIKFLRASASLRGGKLLLPGHYLDCTPFNLMIGSSGRLTPFDLEYASVQPLDFEFVVFRGLWGALTRQNQCGDPQPGVSAKVIQLTAELMRRLDFPLTEARIREFVNLEARFQNQVIGMPLKQAALMVRQQLLSQRNPANGAQNRYLCQMFWRAEGEWFREENSTAGEGELSDARQMLLLPIPSIPSEMTVLRWDMANRPGKLRVFDLELFDSEDNLAWSMRNFADWSWFRSALQAEPLESEKEGVTFLLHGDDPSVELAIEPAQIGQLASGGTLSVDCQWVD